MRRIDWAGHVAMLGANVMWGMMSPFAKLLMVGGLISPLVLTDLRAGGAMILFWLVSLFLKPDPVPPRDLAKLFGASLLAIVFNQGCFLFGVGLTSPGDASIITTSMPLWAMIFAAFFLKEPITARKVLGIAAGAAGALLLIVGGRSRTLQPGDNPLPGDLLVLCAQMSYALYLVLFKNFVQRYSLVTTMKWMFTFAFICLIPFSGRSLGATDWAALDLTDIGAIAFVVCCGTFGSYLLVIIGQRRLRPTVVGMYNYVQPIVAVAFAIYLGLDEFNFAKLVAVLLIFSGVFLVTSSKSRQDIEKEAKNSDNAIETE